MMSGLAADFEESIEESEASLTEKAAGFHFLLNVSVSAVFCLCGRNSLWGPS